MIPFSQRVREGIAERGALCVGIDPHAALLDDWGLAVSADGVRAFGLRVIEAAANARVAFVKPQVAFFERFGSAGFAALEETISVARDAEMIVIADAKRGDIGSTMDGYASAWLESGSALEADALTVSPYLGVGSLENTMRFAQQHGKGLFVLAATSNPEATQLQRATVATALGESTVARSVIDSVSAFNAENLDDDGWGSMGFVIGATVNQTSLEIPSVLAPVSPILSPGFGAQGVQLGELGNTFGANASSVIASESRGILQAGPDHLHDAIRSRQEELEVTRG